MQLFAIEAKPISQIGGNKTINVRQGKGQDNVQEGSLGCPLLPAASAALVVLIYTLLESAVNNSCFVIVLYTSKLTMSNKTRWFSTYSSCLRYNNYTQLMKEIIINLSLTVVSFKVKWLHYNIIRSSRLLTILV